MDVLLDRGPRPDTDLGRLDPPSPEPAGEQVEEVDPMLDEDSAAFARSQNQWSAGRFSSEA